MSTSTTKYSRVRDAIAEALRRGEFSAGQKLPGERVLATTYGISYMTARRAVFELIQMGLLERRPWEGVFVVSDAPPRRATGTTTLNVITVGHEPPHVQTLKRLAARDAQQRAWNTRFLRIDDPAQDEAVRAVLNGDLSLLLIPDDATIRGPVGEAVQQVNGRAVLIGSRMDNLGVPSVLADDTQAIGMAVQHLRSRGHRRIGMLCDYINHPVTSVQIAKWRSCFAEECDQKELDRRLIVVDTPRFECPTHSAYERMREVLRKNEAGLTALVCTGDESAVAAMSACRARKCPVPEKMSIVVSGDSSLAAHCNPPLTCIDVNLEMHIKLAGEMLERALAGRLGQADRLRLIEPHLIERGSVGPVA
ncbi:MAG TPA: substrate-binding domain-containing protein [Tepidisphaeraceae bacterium]|nr:substrate-binding domain-containing protein [Tepidisphaeraceae bacterium]